MQPEEIIKRKAGRDTGMKVPDGYFESVYAQVASKLPPYPEQEEPVEVSMWTRVKPYLYMAAMFAGIWLMMKVFHNVTDNAQVYLDNPPEAVVLAMSDSEVSSMAIGSDTYDTDVRLEEDVCGEYSDFDDFKTDFGYTLSPQYASMVIPSKLLD